MLLNKDVRSGELEVAREDCKVDSELALLESALKEANPESQAREEDSKGLHFTCRRVWSGLSLTGLILNMGFEREEFFSVDKSFLSWHGLGVEVIFLLFFNDSISICNLRIVKQT